MKIKEAFVFVLLAASIVAAFGGFALVSRGETMGWLGVALAIPMLYVVQRAMRATSSPTSTIDADDVVARPKPSVTTTVE